MIGNEVLVNGEQLDLDSETQLLPTYQANDLTKPESIQSDYTPEFSVPGTQRNHRLLGQAAAPGNTAGLAYRRVPATLRSAGVETLPLAILYIKGYEGGRYQLQLAAGNRRLIEALGEKTLRDLDFSRFNHRWTRDNIAGRLDAAYFAENGWGYLLADRGKPLDLAALSPYELYPTVSARLIWAQMLAEAGFQATPWPSPLLDLLEVPSVAQSGLSEAFAKARSGSLGIGPGHERSYAEQVNRGDEVLDIPFDLATDPGYANSPNGNFDLGTFTYTADTGCYVDVEAALPVQFTLTNSRCSAKVYVDRIRPDGYTDRPVDGVRVETNRDGWVWASASAQRVYLDEGDRLVARVQVRGLDSGGSIFGFKLFSYGTPNGYRNYFRVTVTQELAPNGPVQVQDWLPEIKQLDFLKTLIQLGGLTPQVDPYEDRLLLSPSRAVVDNVPQARDWTTKRDAPAVAAHLPRAVTFRFGSYGQRNYLRWATDGAALDNKQPPTTAPEGYGDGYLSCPDLTLPEEATLATLPFAATLGSTRYAGLPLLPLFKLGADETDYERQTVVPRLLLRSGETLAVTLLSEEVSVPVTAALTYFALPGALPDVPQLDLQAYVLPQSWAGLRAMLPEARYLKERYRLSASDVAGFDFTRPVWDGVLGDFFVVSRIVEHDPARATVVELARLHPSLLPALPAPGEEAGAEFYGTEFYSPEFY